MPVAQNPRYEWGVRLLGIVTGLTAEARLAARLGPIVAGGGTSAGAARAAHRLADGGATALLSFGLAGGLNAAFPPGALIVPAVIVTDADRYMTDSGLNAWLQGAAGTMFGGDAVVATQAAKQALRARSGADAVDLESGAVASVARARGLRFAALRAICDPAAADLPPAALVALDGRGAIGFARVLASVFRHPGQLPSLLRLSSQAALARAALLRAVAGLALPAP